MINSSLVHRTFMLSVCLMTAGFFLLVSSNSAKAQAVTSTSNYTETVFPTIYSGCAGRISLSLKGQIHFVLHTTETPSGQRLLREHTNFQGVNATDNFGNQYSVASQNNDTLVLEEEQQQTATVVQYFRLIGKGLAANERVKTTNHLTINDNGEITSIFSKFEADCDN